MDALIKNNIIKKNKMIVDIGMFATKVLDVHYAAKKVSVTDVTAFDNKSITSDGYVNFDELAKKINSDATCNGRGDVVVSLPADLCENKIVTIKNKKESEIKKIIQKEHFAFGRVNPITHVVDYSFLGKREEQGDTVFYFLISAVTKSIANELVNSFKKYNLKVKGIVSSVYCQICLSSMFFDDYEYLSRLMIDFGTNTTRVVAFSEGIAVYTRVLEFGFESYVNKMFTVDEVASKLDIIRSLIKVGESRKYEEEKERYFSSINEELYYSCIEECDNVFIRDLSRVIDLCNNNDVPINKIYCTGFCIDGFAEKLKDRIGMDVETVSFGAFDTKEGEGYLFEIGDNQLSEEFSNAVGLSISPML